MFCQKQGGRSTRYPRMLLFFAHWSLERRDLRLTRRVYRFARPWRLRQRVCELHERGGTCFGGGGLAASRQGVRMCRGARAVG